MRGCHQSKSITSTSIASLELTGARVLACPIRELPLGRSLQEKSLAIQSVGGGFPKGGHEDESQRPGQRGVSLLVSWFAGKCDFSKQMSGRDLDQAGGTELDAEQRETSSSRNGRSFWLRFPVLIEEIREMSLG